MEHNDNDCYNFLLSCFETYYVMTYSTFENMKVQNG